MLYFFLNFLVIFFLVFFIGFFLGFVVNFLLYLLLRIFLFFLDNFFLYLHDSSYWKSSLNFFIILLPLSFFILKNHGLHFYKNQNYTFQFIRGLIHTLGFFFVLMGVLKLPLSVVYPVLFTSPLMLLLMSHFILNENICIKCWI